MTRRSDPIVSDVVPPAPRYEQQTWLDRLAVLERLDRGIARWQAEGLDCDHPAYFEKMLADRAAIEAGAAYRVVNVIEELIGQCARGMHAAVMARDEEIRHERAAARERKRRCAERNDQ